MNALKRSTFLALSSVALWPAPLRAQAAVPQKVTIVYQNGIGYAAFVVLKSQGTLEKRFAQTSFDWRQLGNGAAIRDGVIAGDVQVGAGGVPPFLVGWDKGVKWKLLTNLCNANLMLVAKSPQFKSLRDFGAGDKIALPAADAIQAIELRKAALLQLGNARALDNNMVFMPHPQGLQAVLSGQVAATYSSPPFQGLALAQGCHAVVNGDQLFPKASFLVAFMATDFAVQYPDFTAAFYRELNAATAFIRQNPAQTAEWCSKDVEGKISAAELKGQLTAKDTVFESTPHAIVQYALFMQQIGLLDKAPASVKDVELPVLSGAGD